MTTAIAEVTADQARQLTDRIKVAVEGTWHLITEAYTSRAWAALGYSSWDDYCTREFGTSRLRLPREDRSEVVASLRESGLSLRAIASATGYSEPTVRRELSGASNDAPADQPEPQKLHSLEDVAEEFGVDLDELAAEDDDEPALTEAECEALADAADLADDDEPEPEPERITGMDGKSYPKPEPKVPNRRAITDAFWSATFDLGKKVNTLTNLVADDRFSRNADQLAERNLSDLIRTRDELQLVIDQLTN